MTTSTAIPTAQPRKCRTRTKNVSCRPALVVSTLPPHLIELTPGMEHLACPDCETWCPITTDKGSKQSKLVPHHTLPAGTPGTRRCVGSNRLVVLDVPVEVWQQLRADAIAEAAPRRPTTVLKKVKAPQPVALHQLDPAPPTADSALRVYLTHRSRCAGCTGKKHCKDGELLARCYLARLEDEPRRQRVSATLQCERARFDRELAAAFPKRRKGEWDDVEQAVAAADTARRESLVGSRSPILGADVPTDHEDTKEQARARAKARSAKVVLAQSLVRPRNAA